MQWFIALAVAGVAAALFHVHIPHTEVLIDGRWAFGFMGFALLRRWWAALGLAALLSYPYGTPDIPLWIGFAGNMLYAVPALLVIRPLSSKMLQTWGPGWLFGLGWGAQVLVCYQVFTTPAVWGVMALVEGRPVGAGLIDGWRNQPFLVESVLVALFSAAAMVAALAVERMRGNQRRLDHVYCVLLGIRNVNQLIVTEDDPERLIERACVNLTETMGYNNAWIALLGGEAGQALGLSASGEIAAAASAGIDGGFETLREQLERGEFPLCMKRALEADGTIVSGAPASDCPDCPLSSSYGGRAGLARRLVFEGVTYGILTASVPAVYARDTEEQDLFNEVADDLAFALHKITVARHLKKTHDRFRAVFEAANVGKSMTLPTGEVNVNKAFAGMLGYTPEELQGKTWQELTPPEDVPETERRIAPLLDGREDSTRFEKRYVRKDGGAVWADVSVTLLRDPEGRPLYFLTTAVDITERKRAEQALGESERSLRSTLDGLLAHIAVIDDRGEIVLTNKAYRAFAEQNGIEPSTVSEGINYLAVCDTAQGEHSEEAALFAEGIRAVLAGKRRSFELEYPCHSPDEKRWFFGRVTPFTGDGSRRVIVAHENITERKLAEEALRESEKRYRHVLDGMLEGCQIITPEWKYAYVNDAAARQGHKTRDELIGRTMTEVYPGIEESELFSVLRKCFEQRTPRLFDNEFIYPDGHRGFFQLSIEPVPEGLFILSEDITDRKQAEGRIQHLNRVLRAIRDVNQLITHETDRAALLRRSCEILTSTRGYRSAWVALRDSEGNLEDVAESGIGEDFAAVRAALERSEWPECYRKALEHPDGIAPMHDTAVNCKSCGLAHTYRDTAALAGRLRHGGRDYGALVVALPEGLADDEEEQSLFRELIGDVAYALHAMETARQRRLEEARFRTYLEHTPFGIFIADRTGHYVDVNPAAAEVTGYSEDELLAMSIADLLPPESREAGQAAFQRLIGEGRISEEMPFVHKNGEVRHWSVSGVKLSEERFLGFAEDITERKRAEEALMASEKRFKELLLNVPTVAVQGYAPDGRVTYWNRASETLYGYTEEEALGQNLLELIIPPDMRDSVRAAILRMVETGETIPSCEVELMRKDGSPIPLYSSHAVVRLPEQDPELFCLDIDLFELKKAEAEREKLQSQLIQAQKMESVGRLAGGVAHDFNNILQAMMGYSEMLLDVLALESEARGFANEIANGTKRAVALTRQLLAFARKQTIAPKVLDLNETVESMLKMLRRLIGEDIDLAWQPAGDLWRVKMDPGQIDQILANLCVNARDAIEGVGRLTIETENTTFDKAYCADHVGFVPGEFAMLAVSDDGCGMDKETLDHIFEPFFTTKGVEQGTGLGLATVYGIVKQNEGFINVYSEPGEGTTFKVYLPRHASEAAMEDRVSRAESYQGHGETVLFVEDDASILRLGERMLASMNYDVHAFGSADDALEFARTKTPAIHLLITDIVMPEMSGRDLANAILRICPGIRVLFMSGYTANVIAHRGVLDEGVNFIQKPFSVHDLAKRVREALDS